MVGRFRLKRQLTDHGFIGAFPIERARARESVNEPIVSGSIRYCTNCRPLIVLVITKPKAPWVRPLALMGGILAGFGV